uniref:Uncharacterized protein n=1 Tax=Tanacetum cinerariifolium TaxID=118510 RepID=A0A6L2KJ00_TANCI|nr:hypothetical protein [Tanacetum cinerariifolium]
MPLGEIFREFPMNYLSWPTILGTRKAGSSETLGRVTWKASDPDVPRTSPRQIMIRILPFGLNLKHCSSRSKCSKLGKEHGHMPVWIPVTCCPLRYADGELRDSRLLEEMLRLKDLGPKTPTGVPYIDDEIMAMVRQGTQRGHIPSVGKLLEGHDRDVLNIPKPRYTQVVDFNEVKAKNKQLRKEINMPIKVVRSDDKISQLLTQLQSQHEVGSGSGSDVGRDDELGEDEDVSEDEDTDGDEDS